MPTPTAMRDIYVDANGLRHHLTARGNPGSPPVMMLHGLTQQAHIFDAVAEPLSESCHVYCLDIRGRGETEWGPADGYHLANYVDDLEAVRAALGLERFALVGTSLGGLISIVYAARFPGRVACAVINDIGPEIDPNGLQRIMQMLTAAPQAFTDMKSVVRYYRESNAPMLGHRSDDDILEYARWHVRKNDVSVLTWKMDPAVRVPQPNPPPAPDLWAAYKSITCPLLIVRGAQTDVLAPEAAAKMVSLDEGTRLVEVAGVGHAPALTEPDVYPALEQFLAASSEG